MIALRGEIPLADEIGQRLRFSTFSAPFAPKKLVYIQVHLFDLVPEHLHRDGSERWTWAKDAHFLPHNLAAGFVPTLRLD